MTGNSNGSIQITRASLDFVGADGLRSSVVCDFSLDIPAGSIVGLVGESGSGKSTVALSLMGLLAQNARIASGEIVMQDKAIALADTAALASLRGRDLAMIFQDPVSSLNPVFTIGAHLHEVLRSCNPSLNRVQRQRQAIEALATVGLDQPEKRMKQHAHELSGGMRQRVVIAMALLARPKLLIADEPTTALDVTVEAQVMRQMCELRNVIGCSILLITHSLGLVARYCDYVAVMYAGEIVERGRVSDVVGNPAHPYTQDLFGCDVSIDEPRAATPRESRFQVIPGELPSPRQLPPGCIFASRCQYVVPACSEAHPALRRLASNEAQEARCILAT